MSCFVKNMADEVLTMQAIRAILMPEGLSQLYTGSQDETVRVWDCSTGQARLQLKYILKVLSYFGGFA